MYRPLIAGLLALLTAAPAAASLFSYDFSFSGAAYGAAPNDALATGSITFERDLLANPGRSVYDPGNSLQGVYGTPISNLVAALTVVVTGATNGNGTYSLDDFAAVVFDSSLRPLDLTRQLVGQPTASLTGKTWGQDDPNPFAGFVQGYTGDFQLFAKAGRAAPTGIYPFQLGTNGGNDDPLQLISFAPAADPAEVPAPGTGVLLALGLWLLGAARLRLNWRASGTVREPHARRATGGASTMTRRAAGLTAGVVLSGLAGSASAGMVDVFVDGRSGPWDVGLNPSYYYGATGNIQLGPTIVSGGYGLTMAAGDTLTVLYTGGLALAGAKGSLWFDANGAPGWDASGWGSPAYYLPATEKPVRLETLMGAFASSGQILGDPMKIGNGPSAFTIPVGATELLLGFADGWFNDNGGGVYVTITETTASVPVPATLLLVGAGVAGLVSGRRRRKK